MPDGKVACIRVMTPSSSQHRSARAPELRSRMHPRAAQANATRQQGAAADAAPEDEFSQQITIAENLNLRDRISRLEASIAYWASDVDEANEENARLRSEIDEIRAAMRDAEAEAREARADRETLLESVAARDSLIGAMESRAVDKEFEDAEHARTRSRLQAIRRRVRARLTAQAREIERLRRMLSLGHAARREIEHELLETKSDLARNERYLDKLEERLAIAEERARRDG